MSTAVPVAMIVMGVAIAGVWTRDILAGECVDRSRGWLAARDVDGSLLWLHWVAEYATAITLVAGALGVLIEASWGELVAAVGLGALLYTSINSLGWALAERDRVAYAVPMLVGVAVGVSGAVYLMT